MTLKKDWNHEAGFLSRVDADEFYTRLMELPWVDTGLRSSPHSGLHYGRSYGRVNSLAATRVEAAQIKKANEITEIPAFLTATANRVAAWTRVPVNYIQIHRYDSEYPVNPHHDPSGMTVPMVTVGQERRFRVGGDLANGFHYPGQVKCPVERHIPDEEIPMRHGDLLIFNGGRTWHSMFPAAQDSQHFNRNGYDWRFSVLFRWTTPAMRQFGVGICNQHGQADQYAKAVKEFQAQQQRSLF